MDRRDFLKSLAAAAVASAVPAIPAAKVPAVTKMAETTLLGMRLNGQDPDEAIIEDMGTGWHRVSAVFRNVENVSRPLGNIIDGSNGFSFDSTVVVAEGEDYTMSMMVKKEDEKSIQVANASVVNRPKEGPYIPTGNYMPNSEELQGVTFAGDGQILLPDDGDFDPWDPWRVK